MTIEVSQAADAVKLNAFQRPVGIPSPSTNPMTTEKVSLGKTLFFDPRLSRDESMSCASCHRPDKRWSDGRMPPLRAESITLARRTPSVVNSAWLSALMWDGRAHSLEAQAELPITAAHEMNFEMPALIKRLIGIQGYRALFISAFGDAEISQRRVGEALASFQRSLVSKPAPFDRWVSGDESALSARAKQGFMIFNHKARCVACHSSWRFTNDGFHDIGLSTLDLGRGAHVPPVVTLMQFAFKTPSLRDLSVHGPYMHNGSMHSLEEVIKHYERGGIKRESLSPEMKPFTLTDEERSALIEFLHSLDGGLLNVATPQLPH